MSAACDAVRDRLPEYATNTLGRELRTCLEAHFALCGECRADLHVIDLLQGAAIAPPEGLERRVMAGWGRVKRGG